MSHEFLRQASEKFFNSLALEEDEVYLHDAPVQGALPGAVCFYSDGVALDNPAELLGKDLQVLFETNILRDEHDSDEKRILVGNESVTGLIRASAQNDGSWYISGELMAHEEDGNRRRVYIRNLLTKVLHEVSEPLRSALATLKASSIAELEPMAYDYLKG